MSKMAENLQAAMVEKNRLKKIKCVVWDLDNTIWDGVLLEGTQVILREGVVDIIRQLDRRGILQSISSKNHSEDAMRQLQKFDLAQYFIYPQINWNSKSSSIQIIAESINIGLDTILFLDDQLFERDEVHFAHPQVVCVDSSDLTHLLDMPILKPRFVTEDSKNRRLLYMNDIARDSEKEKFKGTEEEFLASLDMRFTISRASKEDLQRAEELTIRTHQLNATGYTYSYEELEAFSKSQKHILLIAQLDDKYGTYGKIGLALIECGQEVWTLKLLLMSCRVMSRGVGSVMLGYILRMAKEAGVYLRAEFVYTERNRLMYITYKFAGFRECETRDGISVLENDLSYIQPYPPYLTLRFE